MSIADDLRDCHKKASQLLLLRDSSHDPSALADAIQRLTEEEKESLLTFLIVFGPRV